jgi:NADPH:quinone reductase-like Zn-dependent oxidoreductase
MKAITITDNGSPTALQITDRPRPTPAGGQVLVRVHAAGVNPIDGILRAGYQRAVFPLNFPWTPGMDVAGVIEAIGPGVTAFAVGDAVFGTSTLPVSGTYADYVAVPVTTIAHLPTGLGHVEAAAIPIAAQTAWQGLFTGGLDLVAGQRVLILGAAGGVGGFAIQLAKMRGVQVVAAARSVHAQRLHGLGADLVVDTANELSAAGSVDAVFDLVGGDLAGLAWAQLRRGGSFISATGQPAADRAAALGARAAMLRSHTDAGQLAAIAALVQQGHVNVSVATTLPLARAREAHELLARRGVTGKIVLTVV